MLVLLAIVYMLSPFFYPLFSSFYFGLPLSDVISEYRSANSTLRNIEIFCFPAFLGSFILLAKRPGYFAVVIGSLYLFIRNIFVFLATSESGPTSGLFLANIFLIVVIVYLSRPRTRMIFFNSKVRWWETDPRYFIDVVGRVSRVGGVNHLVKVKNVAIGGAAIEVSDAEFAPGEWLRLEFSFAEKAYQMTATVVWDQAGSETPKVIGLQWVEGKEPDDSAALPALMKSLKAKGVRSTRHRGFWFAS